VGLYLPRRSWSPRRRRRA